MFAAFFFFGLGARKEPGETFQDPKTSDLLAVGLWLSLPFEVILRFFSKAAGVLFQCKFCFRSMRPIP